jgi:alpha-glucosidase
MQIGVSFFGAVGSHLYLGINGSWSASFKVHSGLIDMLHLNNSLTANIKTMKRNTVLNIKLFIVLASLFCMHLQSFASEIHSVMSPDGRIGINVKSTDQIYYSIIADGKEVIWYSPIALYTSKGKLGINPRLIKSENSSADEVIKTLWGTRSEIRNEYNELKLSYANDFSLIFRAYDDGIAYRFETSFKDELIVYDETVEYRFLDNHGMKNHLASSYSTSYEALYIDQTISEIKPEHLICLPSVVILDGLKLAILESDVYEYPGMYLGKRHSHRWNKISATFPKYPTVTEVGGDRHFNVVVKERADYIARTSGKRQFPWRAMVIAREDRELLDSDLVYKLARPAKISTDWIKPGLVAWDWWNALNLDGVGFKSGINNESYEYFIDFAAENGIPYVILDEGWSDQFDLMLPTSEIDMERLTSYAEEKGVKLILWAVWHAIDRQKKQVFKQFQEWGIAGVKVDFINRDDQLAIEFYEDFAAEAAKFNLLVNYHGCSKPTGLHRTYPNVLNFEAVRGNEYNKFSQTVPSPKHNVDISFIRMLAGPLDYTPGAMRNALRDGFLTNFDNPMSLGTRAHQLGMFIVYFAPMQMLCDAPTRYERYPDILNFISGVPVSWDETIALEGVFGEYAVVARKKDSDWYIGGLTNWNAREVTIDLAQFAAGDYKAVILRDGINADRMAEDYIYEERSVSSDESLQIPMMPGGGFAILLKKQ